MRIMPLLLATTLSISLCPGAYAGTADNVRTAKRVFLENLGEGRFDRLEEIYAPHFVAHGASPNATLEQDVAAMQSWRTAMPDLKVTVERTVGERDRVAVHWRLVGINTVAAGGLPGKGDRIGIEGMSFFRFSAGRIVEEWSIVDVATLRKQLGEQ